MDENPISQEELEDVILSDIWRNEDVERWGSEHWYWKRYQEMQAQFSDEE